MNSSLSKYCMAENIKGEDSMSKNKNIPLDEQETIILYDYKERKVNIYTCKPSCRNRLEKLLGKPHKDWGGVCDWYLSFDDRDLIRKSTNISTLLTRKKI